MGPEAGGAIIGLVCGALIGALIGSLIGAVVLRAAAKWAENLELPFGAAYATVLLTYLANMAIGMPIGFLVGASGAGKEAQLPMQLFLLPVGFLIQAKMISSRHGVSFGKGAKIAGFMLLIGLLIGFVLGGIALLVVLATSR